MLRALLLGLLAVSSAACSKSSTEASAKAVPGQAAGKVLEAKGSVQVKRGAETKPLAAGDTVEASDVVVTGADGNVVIELAHNSARWELGPNKETKVSESVAWKAKKATAEEVDQATAAAGRPAERSAAGTVAMADEGAAPAPAEAPAPEAAMAPAPPPPAAGAERAEADMSPKGGSAPVERTRRRASKAAAAAPEKKEAEEATDDEAPAPRTRRGAVMKTASADSVASADPTAETAKAMPPPAPGGGGPTTTATRGKPTVMARSADPVAAAASTALGAKNAALGKCMADAGAKDEVTMSIRIANGKPTVTLTSKAAVSAGLDKCLKGVVAGVTFTGSTTITKIVRP